MLSERERLMFDEIAANLSGMARSSRRRQSGSRVLTVVAVCAIGLVAAIAAAWVAVGVLTVAMLASTGVLLTLGWLGVLVAVLLGVGLRKPRRPSTAE